MCMGALYSYHNLFLVDSMSGSLAIHLPFQHIQTLQRFCGSLYVQAPFPTPCFLIQPSNCQQLTCSSLHIAIIDAILLSHTEDYCSYYSADSLKEANQDNENYLADDVSTNILNMLLTHTGVPPHHLDLKQDTIATIQQNFVH